MISKCPFRFFDTVFEHKSVKQVNYPDYNSAYQAVKDGQAWGVIHTPANFSKYFLTRLWSSIDAEKETLNKSSIEVSVFQIVYFCIFYECY